MISQERAGTRGSGICLEWFCLALKLFTVHFLFLLKFVGKHIVHEHLTPMLYYALSLPMSLLAWTIRETGFKKKTINFIKLFWVSFFYWVIWGPRSGVFSYEKEKRKHMESEENLLGCWIMMSLKRERFPTAESNILQTRIFWNCVIQNTR